MRTFAARMAQGRSGRRLAIFARRGLAAALLLGPVPVTAQATGWVTDSVKLENRAYVSYQGGGGAVESSTAVATVLLQRTQGVAVTPSYDVVMAPGERRVLAQRVQSNAAAADHFRMDVAGPAGWRVEVYRDLDGDGVLGPADLRVTAPIDLRSGEGAALLLVIDVPDDYTGQGGPVELRATSTTNSAISGSVLDRVTIRHARVAATLAKAVDRSEATGGDTLRYTVVLSNTGEAPLQDAVIRDPLPGGVRFLAGSLRLQGSPLTDAADADAGTVERDAADRETVRVRAGTLLPGATAAVTFGVVVQAGAPDGSLSNVASASYAGLTTDLTSVPAETRVSQGKLELTKQRLGSDTVRTGAEVAYRLGYANRSTVPIRDVVLVDTLAPELAYVSADGSPEVSGQVLRWQIGTLAPGSSGSITVVTRAVLRAGSTSTVRNRVAAQGARAVAAVAEAPPVVVVPLNGNELEIHKRAGVLEGGVGEAVPYSVTIRNRGQVPLRGIVVHDRLPAGMRLVTEGVVGADSVRVDGQDARFFVAGPLAPGAEHTLRYAASLLSPGEGAALGNQAWAEAEDGRLRTDTTTAWVRMRRGYAMQERTLIGKVWLDENGDGVQQPGEKGVGGASVWSAAGEVVTTDREGRFSFRNLRPGTQLVRLDTVGLPGEYAIARNGDDMVQVRMDGWTTPRASFRLVRRLPSSDWEQVHGAGKGATGPTPGDRSPGDEAVVEVHARRLPPRVAPLRSDEDREAAKRSALIDGPEVRIFSPTDGTVIGTNRLYIGVRGEAGAPVRLYDGDRLLREATLRPDGVWDFIGVEVSPGPHRLRVWMMNSWQKERWDSVAVHRSGEPASFQVPAKSWTLRSDAPAAERLRVRVLDAWNVPVADSPSVTVTVRGATVTTTDIDASSVGMQVRTELDGWMEIALKGGREVGPGEMLLAYQKVKGRVPLRVLPVVRPIIATGIGQVGVGAAPGAFGAVTVKGAIGSQTSVTLSYDSRRANPDNDFFAGGYDPLEESRYPTLGDQSQRRNLGSATQVLSARVERGFDWLEFGDVQTTGFGGDGRLGTYQRSLTGMSGRVATGAVVWQGFGSLTDQSLEQRQLRGDGTSGPYRVGGRIRPGTERVAIEVRARENAARIVARQELARFTDYQVDYETGYILLQRAVPATDPQGNPVFVVATLERRSGGESRFVGGLRMELDASRLLRVRGVDSLGVGVYGIRDGAGIRTGFSVAQEPAVGYDLFGGDLKIRHRGLEAGVEMIRSVRPDSSATAAQAQLSWTAPGDRGRVEAGWLRVGEGFAASANPRLASGLDELRLAGEVKLPTGSVVRLRHERQHFNQYGVERNTTFLTAEQSMAGRKLTAEGGVANDLQSGAAGTSSSTAMAKATLAMTPRMDVWVEGSQLLSSTGTQPTRPDQMGVGVGYRVLPGTRLEGAHRWVRVGGDSASYSLTSFNLRTQTSFGSEMWGGVEHADVERAANSAVLGWNQRLSMTGGWSLNSMIERRFGLNRAPLLDPVRALPFAQPEQDRWAGSLGVEWLPSDSTARFSARGEMHDGRDRTGFRFDVAGDLPLGPSVSLLTRHDWSQDAWTGLGNGRSLVRDRSLVGFAFRPVASDAFNALAKLEWRRSANPLLGTEALVQARNETRLIGSADAVWSPSERSELAWRYAVRWSVSQDSSTFAARSLAHYAGMQAQRALFGSLSARMDSRLLLEGVSQSVRWSVAPALVYRLNPQLQLEGGYRMGDLRDPDFFTSGGAGFYATLGMRFNEQSLRNAAAFWRERVAHEF